MTEQLYVMRNNKFYKLYSVDEQSERAGVSKNAIRLRRFHNKSNADKYIYIPSGNYEIEQNYWYINPSIGVKPKDN